MNQPEMSLPQHGDIFEGLRAMCGHERLCEVAGVLTLCEVAGVLTLCEVAGVLTFPLCAQHQ